MEIYKREEVAERLMDYNISQFAVAGSNGECMRYG